MLHIDPDDGGSLDEEHAAIILEFQESGGGVALERLRERLRACKRPASVRLDDTPAPDAHEDAVTAPLDATPPAGRCCGR
jgi:hypothetical protein